ncbi:MAG: glycosyltransferase [Caulobacter sp. 12-67-6]|nr:MAG: glycosyltransferase [Caulobacter sp. 12-67-6]OYX68445.1 MAG: glycosyltransferase [Caulobacter sp. 32-67-35]OZA77640.1 MAG: glycosyltransferase [Caulobacter sp. 39-67-4]HQR87722.1 glycosyltransferase [Caulobacter sp.]
MTAILHAMLGKGLGGLERVFLDYQPILEAYAAKHGGTCTGVVRRGGSVSGAEAMRSPPLAVMPAFTDWDPWTVGAARRLVETVRPDLILSHGQRPARLFARLAPAGVVRAVCVHKPSFDVVPGTHYLCVGRHLAELAVARGVPSALAHFVPNAVAEPAVQADPFAAPGTAIRIVAAGRLHPKKGFDVLIRAIGLLRARGLDVVCDIAGEGEERAHLEHLIAELDLGAAVSLIGWTADISTFLAMGDLFAFPSHQEGFPLALLEAMAVALPVVSSAIDGPVEMVADGETGRLVSPDDPAALADALADLIARPDVARTLGERARETVLRDYGSARLARRLEAVLDRMLARG